MQCHPEFILRYTQDPELAERISGSYIHFLFDNIWHK